MKMPSSDLNDTNPALYDLIYHKIAESPQQRITFAEYMEWVLYHPEQGYYATNQVNIGKQGDFFTAPHLGADFGEVLAEQFVQMWEILGKPQEFSLVEMGAGQGILAHDILHYLQQEHPELWTHLNYIIIEKSAGLQSEQQQRLSGYAHHVKWCAWEEIANHSLTGCFFSNELVDALPVHQIVKQGGTLQEVYVTNPRSLQEAGEVNRYFSEAIGELSTAKISDYLELVEIDLLSSTYADGYRSEVNLAALDWINTVTDKLNRGYLLTIDYGYPAPRYHNPNRREGTLQCYYRHRYHNNPYIFIGHQDLTAHVNFTALEKQGQLKGLEVIGTTQQGLFLMALGLGDRIAALSTKDAQVLDLAAFLRRREALHQLIDPMGLGGFCVLIQGKGLTDREKGQLLKGLWTP